MTKQQPTELDLLSVMQSRLGIKEIPGPDHNEIIVSWWSEVGWSGIKDDETAWCSICLCSAAKEAGLPMPPHDVRPLARGWLKWGVPAEPQPGAVGVWPRGTSDWQGHIKEVPGDDASPAIRATAPDRVRVEFSLGNIGEGRVTAYGIRTEAD